MQKINNNYFSFHLKMHAGFTLIEVLLALAVIAIALTALFKTTSENIANTNRLKEKSISHWVAMQGASMVQLGLLPIALNQELTQATNMFGQRWYWRVKSTNTPFRSVAKITIKVSKNQSGPFQDPLITFRYEKNANQ